MYLTNFYNEVLSWREVLSQSNHSRMNEIEEGIQKLSATCDEIASSYDASVKTTESLLCNRIDEMSKVCDNIITSFRSDVQTVFSEISDQSEKTIETYARLNQVLHDKIEELKPINKVIEETCSGVSLIRELLKQHSDISANNYEVTQELLAEINAYGQKLINTTSSIDDVVGQIKTISIRLKSSIESYSDKLDRSLDMIREDTIKGIKINRWILIVGFVLTMFIFFVR